MPSGHLSTPYLCYTFTGAFFVMSNGSLASIKQFFDYGLWQHNLHRVHYDASCDDLNKATTRLVWFEQEARAIIRIHIRL
jgi:hypothetical protein